MVLSIINKEHVFDSYASFQYEYIDISFPILECYKIIFSITISCNPIITKFMKQCAKKTISNYKRTYIYIDDAIVIIWFPNPIMKSSC